MPHASSSDLEPVGHLGVDAAGASESESREGGKRLIGDGHDLGNDGWSRAVAAFHASVPKIGFEQDTHFLGPAASFPGETLGLGPSLSEVSCGYP